MLIVLNLKATEVDTRTNPAGSPQLGTMWIGTDNVVDKATNASVGTHNGVCVRVRKPDMWLCHGGWDLQKAGPVAQGKKGNLSTVGLADFRDPKFTIAICGGTDDFRKAQGQLKGESLGGQPALTDYTLEIEIP
jgi:hypothetical protein